MERLLARRMSTNFMLDVLRWRVEPRKSPKLPLPMWDGYTYSQLDWRQLMLHRSFVFLITTQAKRNLSSRSGIGGVLSAT